jgi:hypothetical protein
MWEIFVLIRSSKTEKMKTKNSRRWFLQSVMGLLLTGAGLSACIDAGLVKLQGGHWFWYGTVSLLIFQSGLCLLIDSLRYKSKNKKETM